MHRTIRPTDGKRHSTTLSLCLFFTYSLSLSRSLSHTIYGIAVDLGSIELSRPPDKWFFGKFRIDYGESKLYPIQLRSGQNLLDFHFFFSLQATSEKKVLKFVRSYYKLFQARWNNITFEINAEHLTQQKFFFCRSGHERNHDESTLYKVTRELLTGPLNYYAMCC